METYAVLPHKKHHDLVRFREGVARCIGHIPDPEDAIAFAAWVTAEENAFARLRGSSTAAITNLLMERCGISSCHEDDQDDDPEEDEDDAEDIDPDDDFGNYRRGYAHAFADLEGRANERGWDVMASEVATLGQELLDELDEDKDSEQDEDDEKPACFNCHYTYKGSDEEPCKSCCHAYPSRYCPAKRSGGIEDPPSYTPDQREESEKAAKEATPNG